MTDGDNAADAAVATSTQKERKQGGAGESVLTYVTDGDNAADKEDAHFVERKWAMTDGDNAADAAGAASTQKGEYSPYVPV